MFKFESQLVDRLVTVITHTFSMLISLLNLLVAYTYFTLFLNFV